ncbi:MAG: DUF423 domain-containing protein [Halieaceae bacterium]|jgi:uncharacterized membrane protein YgdD (TMEM256/DUF423 family)|nr:DUF423 domain-containing protein [Halieaceae bacterium]
MSKLFITLAALSAMLAVVFGAFGAHALNDKLDIYSMGVFETAVQYHFYHSFALLAVGLIALTGPQTALLKSSGWLFIVGLVVFSGSLYLLSTTGIRWLGALTPVGGLAFIGGWACFAAAAWKSLV